MRVLATRRPVIPLPADRAVCRRCGVIRQVNESRSVRDWCRDCEEVEADIAALTTPKRDGCGTPAGYATHRRHNEPQCRGCRDAMNEYRRSRRATGRAA